jgi:hypothetical protein
VSAADLFRVFFAEAATSTVTGIPSSRTGSSGVSLILWRATGEARSNMSPKPGSDGNIGPTKRSVDVPEYVDLEGKHAKLGQDYAQLMAAYNTLKLKLREAGQAGAFLTELQVHIEAYAKIRDEAEKLRRNNNIAARDHKSEGHGAYNSPFQVISTTRAWTVSAIKLANKLAERIGK